MRKHLPDQMMGEKEQMEFTYNGTSFSAAGTAIGAGSYGTDIFTVRGDALDRAHCVNLTVQQTTPEEPLTLDSWSTRSDNGIVRTGCEVQKVAQLINTVTGAKTAIRGRARFELVLDDRLTYTQRLSVAAALFGVLYSTNNTSAAASGTSYHMRDTNLYRFVNGLFLPDVGQAT